MILDDFVWRIETTYTDPDDLFFQQGVNLFTGFMPDTPDFCLALYEYAAAPPGYTFGGKRAYENVRLQLLLRGPPGEYSSLREVMERLKNLFDGKTGEVMNGVLYHRTEVVSDVFTQAPDSLHRERMSFDLSVVKEPHPVPSP